MSRFELLKSLIGVSGKKMYSKCLKRVFDFVLSLMAIIVLSPLLLILTIIGTFCMKGNPFFIQERPGLHEKIFKLIKFRTMSNAMDRDGKLLPDDKRLNWYGKLLRSTSLDELPELINILIGDMSIVGPRPLVPEYLVYYSDHERMRHNVRPGLTGLAQVNGRSYLSWEEIFSYDIEYINSVSALLDIRIIFRTIIKVLEHENIADSTSFNTDDDGKLYVIIDGEKKYIHRALNEERMNPNDNRKW